jgi:hypothetical protein
MRGFSGKVQGPEPWSLAMRESMHSRRYEEGRQFCSLKPVQVQHPWCIWICARSCTAVLLVQSLLLSFRLTCW